MNGPKNGAARLLDRFAKPQPMKETPMPKVAICIPSGDVWQAEFGASMYQLGVMNGAVQGMAHIPTALINTRGSLVVRNRNEAIDHAVTLGVDYVLFLDSDMVFPGWTLRRLLSHNKDIVGGTYLMREPPHTMLGVWPEGTELSNDRIHAVNALPGGCILIKLSVFEKMVKPYYRTPAFEAEGDKAAHIQGEDYYFCEQAAKLGHQIWIDWGLTEKLGHVGKQVVKIQVQPQMVAPAEALPGEAVAANEEAANGQVH